MGITEELGVLDDDQLSDTRLTLARQDHVLTRAIKIFNHIMQHHGSPCIHDLMRSSTPRQL